MEQGTSVAPVSPAPSGDGASNTGGAEPSNRFAERENQGTEPARESASDSRTAAPTAAGKPAVDWEQRFHGLNGNFQQTLKQLDQVRQQATQADQARSQLETQMAEIRWQLQGLNPNQIAEAKKLLNAHNALKSREQALQAQHGQLMQMAELLEPVIRKDLAGKIASEHPGVDPADIEDAGSPEEMRRLAAKLQKKVRSNTLEDRKAAGTDKAESGGAARTVAGSAATPRKNASAFELLRAGVAKERRR